MKRPKAEETGGKAMDFLIASPDALNGFLNVSGLSPDEILDGTDDSAIRVNALHYIASDESMAKAFCEAAGLKPGELAQILGALDPHGATDW